MSCSSGWARLLQHVQQHRLAGQLLQLSAEPVGLRAAMAVHHAWPGGLDINPDLAGVPADRHRGYSGRPSYPVTAS